MLSPSSVAWIDEAMSHNNAQDGEEWLRARTREVYGSGVLPLFGDRVDGRGNLRHEVASFNLSEALLRSAS
jgi:hypothetical protein